MRVSHPTYSLVFGGLTMVEDGTDVPDANGVTYTFEAQDSTFGNAIPITKALLTLMRAGGPEAWDRTDFREYLRQLPWPTEEDAAKWRRRSP